MHGFVFANVMYTCDTVDLIHPPPNATVPRGVGAVTVVFHPETTLVHDQNPMASLGSALELDGVIAFVKNDVETSLLNGLHKIVYVNQSESRVYLTTFFDFSHLLEGDEVYIEVSQALSTTLQPFYYEISKTLAMYTMSGLSQDWDPVERHLFATPQCKHGQELSFESVQTEFNVTDTTVIDQNLLLVSQQAQKICSLNITL